MEQAVKSLARVRYVGFVEYERLGELFGAPPLSGGQCVLMLPSLAYENSPTSIGESFVHGAPVVASRIGGIPELAEDGINGFLFAPGNADELKMAMERAMRDWNTLHEGAQKSAADFSIEHYRQQIEALL